MNPEQVKAMTDEQLRVEVAKLCGWKFKSTVWFMRWLWGKTLTQRPVPRFPNEWLCGYLPKYSTDLNAMAEAEDMLGVEGVGFYEMHLANIVGGGYGIEVCWGATARQRAEAFVLAMQGV